MVKLKQNKGITLIALVITIILLLILAGIVITLAVGQNGILKRAEQSSIAYKKAEAREKLELTLLDLQADKVTDNTYNSNGYIDKKNSTKWNGNRGEYCQSRWLAISN